MDECKLVEIVPSELIIFLAIVLLIFGPGHIASLGRELGASIRQFRHELETHPESDKGYEK